MSHNNQHLSTVTRLTALALSTVVIAAIVTGCATQSSSGSVYRSSDTQREQTVRMATVEAVARENGAVLQALAPTGCAVFPAEEHQ